MPSLSDEQYRSIKRRLESALDTWIRERAHLEFWRHIHEAERIARGNRITLDEWPPRERTPRRKHTSDK